MNRNLFFIRILSMIFLLCFISSSTVAQKINLDTLNFKQLNQYMVKAYKMRNAGMIITLSGVGILATGYITSAIMMGRPRKPDEYFNDAIIPYFLGICVGIPIAIVGIPFWVIGGIKNAKAENALMKIDFKTNTSMAVGIRITIRF